ncbi:hypothetical protein EH244_29285 [Variovorax beijingensis]|uniref:Transposase n=1 Tax=Variovorax beijingensis TaxID=2496117 RepID=A0A3P3E419_9BURK|nr:DUF6262 family protein [Variovorax beijingensis]RRH81161.1 hypothetical protein EH244_29285 [Variovorax beijingensis]
MSGRQTGAEYQKKVEAFLRGNRELPLASDGSVNMTELARLAGVPKQSLYKNPNIRAVLDTAMSDRGVRTKGLLTNDGFALESAAPSEIASTSRGSASERRVHQLEQQNAALIAENDELRRQLKALRLQLGREDMIIETGRRIAGPEKVLN